MSAPMRDFMGRAKHVVERKFLWALVALLFSPAITARAWQNGPCSGKTTKELIEIATTPEEKENASESPSSPREIYPWLQESSSEDVNGTNRYAAIECLGIWGGEEGLETLVSMLYADDGAVTATVDRALRARPYRQIREHVLGLLEDRDCALVDRGLFILEGRPWDFTVADTGDKEEVRELLEELSEMASCGKTPAMAAKLLAGMKYRLPSLWSFPGSAGNELCPIDACSNSAGLT